MARRIDLHNELLKFLPNVYFQPPTNMNMQYPCIIYSKSDKRTMRANGKRYFSIQGYQVMLVERNPESSLADEIEDHFEHCSINQYYTVDNLNHTTINLFY